MSTLQRENKDTGEQCNVKIEVKSEVENVVDCYNDNVPSIAGRADTQYSAVSTNQPQILKVKMEEGVGDNFGSVKAEPPDSNAENTGDFIAGCDGDLKLKTEEIDLGCDYIEDSQDSTSIDNDQKPQTYEQNITGEHSSKDIDTQNQPESKSSKKAPICTVCNKQLARSRSLKTHMLIHTGEKPHECCFCKKKFSLKAHLKAHILTHTGEKPHPCPLCEKKFIDKASVRSHMLSHIKERIHKCEICDRKFSNVRYLKNHMKVHSGEKNHTCTICNQKFVHRSSIHKHMKRHTAEN